MSLNCRACNASMYERDYFPLPDGTENDLCSACIRVVDETLGYSTMRAENTIEEYYNELLRSIDKEMREQDKAIQQANAKLEGQSIYGED